MFAEPGAAERAELGAPWLGSPLDAAHNCSSPCAQVLDLCGARAGKVDGFQGFRDSWGHVAAEKDSRC